jgi:hypothetical protein
MVLPPLPGKLDGEFAPTPSDGDNSNGGGVGAKGSLNWTLFVPKAGITDDGGGGRLNQGKVVLADRHWTSIVFR